MLYMELPKIIVSGKYTPNDLDISVSGSSRKIDPIIEQKLDVLWNETMEKAKQDNRVCYNGISYRLNSILENGRKLKIDFGIVEYKVRHELVNISGYNNLSEEFFCKSCSCSATIKTADNKYVMVELSGRSMNINPVDLVGGIMETDLEIHAGNDIFKLFYKELEEEIGVTGSDIDEVYLQTIFLEHTTNICFYFEVTLKINAKELLLRFRNNKDVDIKSIQTFNKSEYRDVLKNHQNKNRQLIAALIGI